MPTKEMTLRDLTELLANCKEFTNSYDKSFCKTILSKAKWTERENRSLKRLLFRYKKVILKNGGIDPAEAVIPPAVQERKKAEFSDNRLIINADHNKLNEINFIPGRAFHSDTGKWSIPNNEYSQEYLEKNGYDIPETIKVKDDTKVVIDIPEDGDFKLYPYQKEGVKLIEKFDGNVLLGDEMGLGKSAQALSYMKIHPELRPALLIVPASLKINWSRELKKWGIKENYKIINGTSEIIRDENIIIINYDVLTDYVPALEALQFKILVADESHMIKNPSAQRTKAVKYLCKGIDKKIFITGTPMDRPKDLYTVLNLLDTEMFPNYNRFLERYCQPKTIMGRRTYDGASNTKELHNILAKRFMIRRLKKEVLKDLPPKQRSIIPIELSNLKEYDYAEKDLINYLLENEGKESARKAMYAEAIVKLSKLKQLSTRGKMEGVHEWTENFLESGEKLVLFCLHHRVIDELMEKYKDIAVKLDGRDSQRKRQRAVDSFQKDKKIKIFIGQTQAAGVGITLTAASNVGIIEFPWKPSEIDQEEDRCHRIGTTAESVNIYYFTGFDTIDERILSIVDKKRAMQEAVLNGSKLENEDMITELIKDYKKNINEL